MCFSVVPFTNLPRLHKFIFNGIINRKLILSQLPLVGPIYARQYPTFPLQFWNATHIILVCSAAPGGCFPDLQGPKNDLLLLLALIEYCHDQDDRKIILIHDFDVTIVDANQVQKYKSKTPTSRDVIRSTILQTMEEAGPSGKVFFYFGGHGELVEPEAATNPSPGIQGNAPNSSFPKQNIVVGNNERISGAELYSWFCSASNPSVPVIAIFDTCFSGGSLGLPFTYDLAEGWVKAKASLHHGVRLPMLQISACRAREGAGSVDIEPKTYGWLTWALARYLAENKNPTIESLARYLYKDCARNPARKQTPQICCSRKLAGRIWLW